MKAIGYQKSLPVDDPLALQDIDLPKPEAQGKDLLVRVEAISVNPVDAKVRKRAEPEGGGFKVLGFDAAGVVESVGDEVTLLQPGDEVWYAGAIDRQGTNAEFHLVDERIVSKKPESLTYVQAAALPLTSVTAWEILFDRLGLDAESTGTLLVIGGAGGVGSILIQLAKQRTNLTIIATASRPETQEWVTHLGADVVVNHRNSLLEELKAVGIEQVEYITSLTNTGDHLEAIAEIIAPQGKLAVIDDPPVLDVMPFKWKSVSIHWELMFTRALYQTDDMIEQHRLLAEVAAMVDRGEVQTTAAEEYGTICAENLRKAHQLIESGTAKGKIVLTGWG
ncbi:MAG: zinc-binding alcohol dehydrogenase family protein [Verrucomicrobiota bacterium]